MPETLILTERRWPVEQYPALQPQNFSDAASFNKLRMPRESLLDSAKDDDKVRMSWVPITVRDGTPIDVLCYLPKSLVDADRQDASQYRRPLLFAIHGGG